MSKNVRQNRQNQLHKWIRTANSLVCIYKLYLAQLPLSNTIWVQHNEWNWLISENFPARSYPLFPTADVNKRDLHKIGCYGNHGHCRYTPKLHASVRSSGITKIMRNNTFSTTDVHVTHQLYNARPGYEASDNRIINEQWIGNKILYVATE